MKITWLPATTVVLITLLCSSVQAYPQNSSAQVQFAQNQSLNSAIKSIKQKTGGRILTTKTISKNGQRIYKIKVLLPSGKVKIFKVAAQ